MTTTTDTVTRDVEVWVPVDVAWRVFTEEMHRWWPLATHSISKERGETPDGVVVEGHLGGAIYETVGADRRAWGTVVSWEPPTRLSVEWTVSPGVVTRWTATFSPIEGGTRLELVHSGFEAHGALAQEIRDSYGSEDGWTYVLGRFVEATSG